MAFLRDDLAQLTAYQSPHVMDDSDIQPVPDKPVLDKPVLDPLDTNESPIDLPEAIKASLATQYQGVIAANRYPDGDQLGLKRSVMDYAIGSAQISANRISCQNITLGNGSDELIRSVIMATCLGNHGSILVASPTFSMYGILAKTLGVNVHDAGRQANFEVDTDTAQAAIASARAEGPPVKAIFMVHPNSPTANALTQRELSWLRQIPEDILVIVDEAYFEFSGHTTLADALSRPNWLVTRTFSKAFRLAAHRVGYGIGHPDVIAALEKLRLPYNLPSFSQAAAQAALAHSPLLLTQIPSLLAERDRLLQALGDHPGLRVWPSDSNFIYVRLSNRGIDILAAHSQQDALNQMFERLKSKGTLIRHTGGGLRISIGTTNENQRTLTNIQQILETKP
ncbi:MAG: histidinol-phosphate transaminase [Cyanobacteria bacterium P01_D01_bin.105]